MKCGICLQEHPWGQPCVGRRPPLPLVEEVLAEKRQDAIDQLKAACLTLTDMLKAKGHRVPDVAYRVGAPEINLRVTVGHNPMFFYGPDMFEQAVAWIEALPIGYTSENCAAWFQPEAVST